MGTGRIKKRRSRNRFRSLPLGHRSVQGRQGSSPTPHHQLGRETSRSAPTQLGLAISQSTPANHPPEAFPSVPDESLHGSERHEHGEGSGENGSFPEHDIELDTVGAPASNGTEESSIVPLLLPNWQVIWGILVTGGTLRTTKEMYQSMRAVADTFARIGFRHWRAFASENENDDTANRFSCLPHFSTLHRKYKPILLDHLAPRGENYLEKVNTRAAGARCSAYSEDGDPLCHVRVVLPSEYARADMATATVFDKMKSTSFEAMRDGADSAPAGGTPGVTSAECVDVWPLVAARKWFYGQPARVSVDMDSSAGFSSTFCEEGDAVRIKVLGSQSLRLEILRAFNFVGDGNLIGVVVNVWAVHHKTRLHIPEFQPELSNSMSLRDRQLSQIFNFVSYRSPSDNVNVQIPDLPLQEENGVEENSFNLDQPNNSEQSPQMAEALRLRRAAIKERKRQIDLAWRNWKKPLLKPGDTVIMLRPCNVTQAALPEQPCTDRLFIVHRFWAEMEERSRHLIYVSGDTALPQTTNDVDENAFESYCSTVDATGAEKFRNVLRVYIKQMHTGKRGLEKFTPISSTGALPSGQSYFIYRFILFWDGFEMNTGSSASGDGFYLHCLNLPVQARASSRAVRVIALTPPGVNVGAVFKRIQEDLIIGITDGFLDYDADGTQRRIFLDLVGVLGDTPALNYELDTLGHTATAFCHLCRVTRQSSTIIGSRYVREGLHGSVTSYSRGFYQHCAVRDSGARNDTCNQLGMKPTAHGRALPLHDLRQALMSARGRTPIVCNGDPIVPGLLDPYRGCFVAPDHLLTGHMRDCINLTFKLLPSSRHRHICEAFMLKFLSDCNLPAQNRLLEHDKKRLFSMSMSDIYALSVVAELGFVQGIQYASQHSDQPCPVSSKCEEAVQIVGSCARLIANLWFLPDAVRDGTSSEEAFDFNAGATQMRQLQYQADTHLRLVRKVCFMRDEDVSALEDNRCNRETKTRLAKEMNLCLLSIKTIDKPNVHRLRELVQTTMPMVGHVSRIGELVLEKAHQSLKRGVKQSNNKNPHLQSMQNIAVNDWQGRLTLLVPAAMEGDSRAIRGCFRLLAGREAVPSLPEEVSSAQVQLVMNALGPSSCVPTQLRRQGMTVLSTRIHASHAMRWHLDGTLELLPMSIISTDLLSRIASSHFRDAINACSNSSTVTVSNSICSQAASGLPGSSFQRGDVLQIVCVTPDDLSIHVPFVVQQSVLGLQGRRTISCSPSFWIAVTFFEIESVLGSPDYFAAVLPVVRRHGEPGHIRSHQNEYFNTYEMLASRGNGQGPFSFVRMGADVRRVCTIHDCASSSCKLESLSGGSVKLIHGEGSSTLDGSVFYIRSRKEGYPPRCG